MPVAPATTQLSKLEVKESSLTGTCPLLSHPITWRLKTPVPKCLSILSSSPALEYNHLLPKFVQNHPNRAPHFCSYCPWTHTPHPKDPTHPKAFSGFPVFKKHLNPLLDIKDIFVISILNPLHQLYYIFHLQPANSPAASIQQNAEYSADSQWVLTEWTNVSLRWGDNRLTYYLTQTQIFRYTEVLSMWLKPLANASKCQRGSAQSN